MVEMLKMVMVVLLLFMDMVGFCDCVLVVLIRVGVNYLFVGV